MNNSWAKVVLDSISPAGKRLITVEARYWRAIHAEVMTHRDRARNAASSRAIPFFREIKCKTCGGNPLEFAPSECYDCNDTGKIRVPNCTYSYISDDPFTPEFIGAEQKGMQSGSELQEPNRSAVLGSIDRMREFALAECMKMYEQGCHKSIINRYLEPWSYITVVMTATEWKNFFRLRIHPKAEKHFDKVAKQIKAAIDASTPRILQVGEWHMPYLRAEDEMLRIPEEDNKLLSEVSDPIFYKKRISAARCARLSYLNHDGVCKIEDDIRIFKTLIHPKIEEDRDDDVIHSSPLEHVAEVANDPQHRSGPFLGWRQFRKEFKNENVEG